jgi:sugar-specific transcriptional regulator TrmB
LSNERIFSLLTQFGLSETDAQVYLHLATGGPQQTKSIAQALKSSDSRVYRSLKSLTEKQIVILRQEYPNLFSAAPFDDVLEIFKKSSLEDARRIEQKKPEALLIWRSIISNKKNGRK